MLMAVAFESSIASIGLSATNLSLHEYAAEAFIAMAGCSDGAYDTRSLQAALGVYTFTPRLTLQLSP